MGEELGGGGGVGEGGDEEWLDRDWAWEREVWLDLVQGCILDFGQANPIPISKIFGKKIWLETNTMLKNFHKFSYKKKVKTKNIFPKKFIQIFLTLKNFNPQEKI